LWPGVKSVAKPATAHQPSINPRVDPRSITFVADHAQRILKQELAMISVGLTTSKEVSESAVVLRVSSAGLEVGAVDIRFADPLSIRISVRGRSAKEVVPPLDIVAPSAGDLVSQLNSQMRNAAYAMGIEQ
jgi:hypothetical protein